MFKNLNPQFLGVSGRQSEIIELALSNRFKGLDLNLLDFAEQVATYGLPHARRLLDSARIRISSFRLPLAWESEEQLDQTFESVIKKLPEHASLAAALGCTRCSTVIEPASDR